YRVEFSADSKRIDTLSAPFELEVWELASGRKLVSLTVGNAAPNITAISRDGSRAAINQNMSGYQIWDIENNKPLGVPVRHKAFVFGSTFSPDSKLYATCSADLTSRVWDAVTEQQKTPPLKHDGYVLNIQFSPNSRYVITGSQDRIARVWDAKTGEPV